MKKLIFEDTTVIKKPFVEIDGVEYEVQDGEFEGGTDLNAQNFNQVQNNIEDYIDGETSMGSIIVEDVKCKNLFSSSNLTNATIDGNGGLITENRRLVSDYINIKNINQLTLSFNTALTFLGLAYYDVDKNFISRTIANDVQTLTSDTPNNAIYVRGFFQSNSETEKLTEASLSKYEVQLEKGTVATDYVEHKDYGITSGSNENGHWIKYADGTMICTTTKSFDNVEFKSTQGALYFCQALSFGKTPQNFISIDSAFINITSGWGLISGLRNYTTTSFGTTQIFGGDNTTQNLTITATLIGKWK